MTSATPPPDAGWYPEGSGLWRWWDGERWTEHTAPLPPEPARQAPPPAPRRSGALGVVWALAGCVAFVIVGTVVASVVALLVSGIVQSVSGPVPGARPSATSAPREEPPPSLPPSIDTASPPPDAPPEELFLVNTRGLRSFGNLPLADDVLVAIGASVCALLAEPGDLRSDALSEWERRTVEEHRERSGVVDWDVRTIADRAASFLCAEHRAEYSAAFVEMLGYLAVLAVPGSIDRAGLHAGPDDVRLSP